MGEITKSFIFKATSIYNLANTQLSNEAIFFTRLLCSKTKLSRPQMKQTDLISSAADH